MADDEYTPPLKREIYDAKTETVREQTPSEVARSSETSYVAPDMDKLNTVIDIGAAKTIHGIRNGGDVSDRDLFQKAKNHVQKIIDADMIMPYDWILDILDMTDNSIIPPRINEVYARECQADPFGIELEDVNIGGSINSIPTKLTKSDMTVTVRDTKDLALYSALNALLDSFGGNGVFEIGVYCTVVLTTIETGTVVAKWRMILTKVGPLPFDYSGTGTHLEYPIAFTQRKS